MKKTLTVSFRLLKFRQETDNIAISVDFVPHASTIRYDITDELITMSSPLGGNPFVLFPRGAPMYNEIRADVQRFMEAAITKVSTADESVRRLIGDDLALATHLLAAVGATDEQFTPRMLVDAVTQPLAARYRPDK